MHRDLIDDATCAQSSRGIRTANSEVRTIARYVLRNRTERTLGIWNHVRRLAIRYDKAAASFLGFVQLVVIYR